MRQVRRVMWPVLVVVVLVVLVVFVFPTRTYLAQRAATADARSELAHLRAENAALEERARLLRTDGEIERLARERYNLVRPGERAYIVLPRPEPDEDRDDGEDRNLLERAWDGIAGLF